MSRELSFQITDGEQLRMAGEARQHWSFIGGAWEESEEGIITPEVDWATTPIETSIPDEHLAFYTDQAYADFEAEFEFRWDNVICGAGFAFRAQDARHYYLVHFPCTGQQYRAEHFWAAISKVDDSGWVKVLKMEMVHGVPSEIGFWHQARLVVKGNEIRLWVDGRPFPVVQDDTYTQPGYVGLQSYSGTGIVGASSFRGLCIRGKVVQAEPWDEMLQPPQNWFYPVTETTYGNCQSVCGHSITRAPNGELLMTLRLGKEWGGKVYGLVRSTDNGRSWSGLEPLPESLSGLLHTTPDGRLNMYRIKSEPPFQILRATSEDNGKTWSEPVQTGEVTFPPDEPYLEVYLTRLLELKDGTLLMFAYARTTAGWTDAVDKLVNGRMHTIYPYPGKISICLRSTDDGQSWSEPANLDGPPYDNQAWMIAKHAGSEISAAQTRDGKILTLVRPYFSPFMWESWSQDGGRTWTPQARGPFPMYACFNSMLATSSGALLIAGRHPRIAAQVSYDDGMTWQCYGIDTPMYANGVTYEVEPDVVLYVYCGKYTDPRIRAQLIRVTPQGLEPVRVAPPTQ